MNPETFYTLSYGLYIVSSESKERKNGYVANTVFQVTAIPSQLAVSCSKNNLSAKIISKSGYFSVSVLHKDVSEELLGRFGYKSGNDIDKFSETQYFTGKTGVPIVTEDSVAWFECKVLQQVDVGSHLLFIGEVLDGDFLDIDKEPITYSYFRNVRRGVAPKNAPTYIEKKKVQKQPSIIEKPVNLQKWVCLVCGYIYDPALGDPDSGIAPGTLFEDLPSDWVCPVCGAEKSDFETIN